MENSEARKRREEAMGIPEPKFLTESHPVYIGTMSESIYSVLNGLRQSECEAFDSNLDQMRITEIQKQLRDM